MFRITALLAMAALILNGCPASMESTKNKLLFANNSDQKIMLLINLSYPDSSLGNSLVDRYINPNSAGYVANTLDLERPPGLTLTVFDFDYFSSRWDEQAGTPDEYLEEDSVLMRYVRSKGELDSVGWKLVYP